MAKEDTEDKLKDDQIPGGNDGERDASDQQEQEAPKDVRGALRAAFKEAADKDNDESEVSVDTDAADKGKHTRKREDRQKDIKVDNKEAKASRKAVSSEGKEDDGENNIQSGDDKEDKSADEANKQKLEPVGYWKTKGKAQWDKIDTETQQAILAREQEVSQGFQQVSQRLKSLEEVEKVLAPRIQTIQTNGYTPAQVVDSLFQWMERLGNPNPAVKLKSLKDLATNFGINLNQIVPKQVGSSEEEIEDGGVGYIDPSEPPPWFSEFAQQVQGEVGTLKKTLDGQKQAAANAFVGNWAKDKKYYGQVSQLMGQLLSSGVIPLKEDGSLDLDEAYDKALKIHPQVSAQVQQEREAEAKAAAKAKAEKDAKERAAKLASARRAGSGIRPAAPSFVPPVASKANGKSKPVSVRDSIRSALDEHSESA